MHRLPTAEMVWGRLLEDRNLSAWVKSCATLEQPRIPHLRSGDDGVASVGGIVIPRRISIGMTEG